jgi:hypothetical protein
MNNIAVMSAFIAEVGVLLGVIIPIFNRLAKITNGQKCQLRQSMLQTYYHCREKATIRQYEFENFVSCYEAYKALGGNSFIDKIYEEVRSWEVIS